MARARAGSALLSFVDEDDRVRPVRLDHVGHGGQVRERDPGPQALVAEEDLVVVESIGQV